MGKTGNGRRKSGDEELTCRESRRRRDGYGESKVRYHRDNEDDEKRERVEMHDEPGG